MLINIILIILFFALISVLIINKESLSILRFISMISTGIVVVLSSVLLLFFDSNSNDFQNLVTYNFDSDFLNLSFSFGLDGISIFFFFLTSLLIFLCVLYVLNENNLKQYLVLLISIELILLIIFSVLDLMLFYIFFEAILIPMFIIIGVYGSRERKVRAVYLFFFYTLCGSLLLLVGVLYIYSKIGSFNLEYLMCYQFTKTEELLLWFAFFLSFASKIPMFPFHIWLPEAHVEAPTIGSVLLAGVLLKLGVYGFIRFSLTLFPYASLFYSPFIYFLSLISIIYASLTALRQTDLKRIIAYSSIAHMNLVTLGIFAFNNIGLEGSIIQSLSHGFVAGGMFFLIGILYSRYHSRFLYYYGGLAHTMPVYSIFFLLLTIANIALPGTSSFTGEFLLLSGIYKVNTITGIIAATSVILSGAYSLWLCNRVLFSNIKEHYTLKFIDLSLKEFFIMFPLVVFIFFIGLYPSIFLSYIHLSINSLLTLFL
uniref:NADH-ubiquinone oxidoreductase chain 4 n=1 Tax=Ochromonas danica TaxID=2986 RepID=Q9G922_OCHDN|nr:NADH dehydrogenase subunit 4 [Ochromonas danica]AAG18383.1 NADH dehydrogenase subunit 4 [Ochromonas danica]